MSQFGVSDHLIDVQDCIICCLCETRIAYNEDFVPNADDLVYGGYIKRMFHFVIPIKQEDYLEHLDGNTLLTIYCVNCRMRLGWKLVATTQESEYFVVGRFFMKLKLLIYPSGETLHDAVFGVANEQARNDQEGGANDQDRGVNEQVPNEQDLGANADQDLGAKEENAEQDGDANEQKADQDRVTNEQDHDQKEQKADQDGDANKQNTNEQDLVANDQNAEQDGDAKKQVPNEQDGGANADQIGGANADQDGDANEKNADQDGGRPKRRRYRSTV